MIARMGVLAAVLFASASVGNAPLPAIAIDYPEAGSIFPPDIEAPTFLWRDPSAAVEWRIEVSFADGSRRLRAVSRGDRMKVGEIDPRCVAKTNELPKLTPRQAASHTWKPEAALWSAMKKRSATGPATIRITGLEGGRAVSRGEVSIRTSKDPVGAPIFYRDVPLMPTAGEKGIIKPIVPEAIPLIAWRLRNIAEPRSRVVMTGLPTCANCHSFSADGKTVGMDMDGPQNDKGLYALAAVQPRTVIRSSDLISWNRSGTRQFGQNRVGFLSRVSPDGQYTITTISGTRKAIQGNFYVVNFKDYRFLQVFYPTAGILAWYSRATGVERPLPGADDPRYVQTDGVWSPDGKYIVFARAEARTAYPPGGKPAAYANDPNEVQIQYDLYRIPFNGGRGGVAERIAGASRNGMSNTFPKVSPDGRWIVFVKCRNGQLMRPDSELWIVPAAGGAARRMRSNTRLMNSWHSFSPNGRWLVFSSKARSPYTQMYLTHIDENGNDSPAILIENSTAANRAVNLPEFVNIPPEQPFTIEAPAVAVYTQLNEAWELAKKGRYGEAIEIWKKALVTDPDDARAHNNLGTALEHTGDYDGAIAQYRKALELNPRLGAVHKNLASALVSAKKYAEAAPEFEAALEDSPEDADLHASLGRLLAASGRREEALPELRKAVELAPDDAAYHRDLGRALMAPATMNEAIASFERALKIDPGLTDARYYLGLTLYLGRKETAEALAQWREALRTAPDSVPVLSVTARVLAVSPDDRLRNGAEAVALAERAERLSEGRNASVLDTLAAAYAEQGRFREAIETARRALAVAEQQGNARLAATLREAIASYEAGMPWREAAE